MNITSKISLGSWGMAEEKWCVWTPLPSHLFLVWRLTLPTSSFPGEHHAQKQLGSTGGSFSGASPHVDDSGEVCGKQKPSLPVRAWSSSDGEESKSTHTWSSCFYIFRTDACTWSKVPQFQNWFSSLLWISPTIFPPQFFKTRHWKTENTQGQLIQFW